MTMRKVIAAGLSLLMCLSMLTGCSLLPPKDAAELIARSNKVMSDVNNYKMDMDMQIELTATGESYGVEIDVELPISMNMEFEVAGNHMHGEADMEMKMNATVTYEDESESMNEAFESDIEMYYVKADDGKSVTMYSNTDDAGWRSEELDADEMQIDANQVMSAISNSSVFEDAQMEKADGIYTVSVSMADMLTDDDFLEIMKDNMFVDGMDIGDIQWDDFADAVGDAVIVYEFDAKNYRLLGMHMNEIEIDTLDFVDDSSVEDLIGSEAGDISMTMQMRIEFSDFGKVEDSDVIVSDDIISDADEFNGMDAVDTDDTDVDIDVIVQPDVDDIDVTEPVSSVAPTDAVFAYNGTTLELPTDYTVFLDDGWHAVEDGAYESFLCMENDKYPYLILYLHTNDGSGTESSVKENGSDGFSLSTSGDDNDYPMISYAGITFGSTIDDVTAVLGEPDSTYSSSDDWGTYASYRYDISYSGEDCDFTIGFTDGVVTDFDLSYWG